MATSAAKSQTPPCILIAGPTAVGKSEIALQLAERMNGEIISVDSMQVYRGLDIGTAKPPATERARVPHHLLDVADLSEAFDAAKFSQLARQAVDQIQARGHHPILCGGTGLYFKAFLDGVGNSPPSDATLRLELENSPLPSLLDELRVRDPKTFETIDQKNPRRVIRAIEVIRLTNRPFSELRAAWAATSDAGSPALHFGISRLTEDLRQRIDQRVDEMFRRGLVDETRELLSRGLQGNRTAMQAIGYRQVVEHLNGEHSLAETIELVKIRTRQFAKRQLTWFRKHASLTWIELSPQIAIGETVDQMAQQLNG